MHINVPWRALDKRFEIKALYQTRRVPDSSIPVQTLTGPHLTVSDPTNPPGSLYIQPRCGSKSSLGEETESATKSGGFQAQLWF